MKIENPTPGQEGYEINWIAKDHFPTDEDGYDSTRCEYGSEVYSEPEEARSQLIENINSSGVDWGYVTPVFFEYIDGLPCRWEPMDYNDKTYFEELEI